MRVACTVSPAGAIYRIYRSGDDFPAQMKRLVPFLLASQNDVLIGGTVDEPDVVLTVGPLDEARDAVFRECVAQYLPPVAATVSPHALPTASPRKTR